MALLSLSGISKAFPGVQALADVSLELEAGEVHALVGENGAGKSTLMKIIAGVYQPDTGTISIDDQVVRLGTPIDSQAQGIRMIYQELTVLDNLDVGRNIMLGREPTGRGGKINWRALYAEAARILADFGLTLDARTPLDTLSIGARQMVEIARAASLAPRVMIMDEPTSSLGKSEETTLFGLIAQLKVRGVGIIYISHRMDEVFSLADRVTVLRDGRLITSKPVAALSRQQVIALMVGRELAETAPRLPRAESQHVVLSARGMRRGTRVRDVSLDLYGGEVLGVAGLIGAGRTELARLLFGADRAETGEVRLEATPLRLRSPRDAVRAGIAYVPEDRKGQGLVLALSVEANMLLSSLHRYARFGLVMRPQVQALVAQWTERLRIRTPSARQRIENLSGGNQQKVILARWLIRQPQVLILDEPTRGIDVGAKAEIYALIREIAAQGVAVMMISSELPEVLAVSDRIVVMHNGQISGEMRAEGATEARILALALGKEAHDANAVAS